MRALRWILGIVTVLAVLAALAIAAGAFWLNTYLHSSDFKQEVEARVGQTLGGSVRLKQVDFDLLNGVKMDGFFYQMEPGHVKGQGTIQGSVVKINCAYSWTDLLQRRLRLTGVVLDQPQVILTRQATAAPLAPPVAEPPPSTEVKPATKIGQGATVPFQFVLERAKITNGAASVRDTTGVSLVELRGVEAKANLSGESIGSEAKGSLSIARTILASGVEITDFYTPVTWDQGSLSASPFAASALGGKLAGGFQTLPTSSSSLDLNARSLNLEQMGVVMAPHSTVKLSGLLDVQSKWRNIESGTLDGEGDAQMSDGKLEGIRLLRDLSHLIRVKELEAPIVKKAQAHFVVQDNQAKLIGLQIESSFFRITGDGVIGFDGALQANLVLILTRDAMRKLPKEVAASFVQKADGTGSIAFQVTGTTANPQTDLPARMLMQNSKIQDAINKALNRFFK